MKIMKKQKNEKTHTISQFQGPTIHEAHFVPSFVPETVPGLHMEKVRMVLRRIWNDFQKAYAHGHAHA